MKKMVIVIVILLGFVVNGLLKLSHFGSLELSHINSSPEAHSAPFLLLCLSGDSYFL